MEAVGIIPARWQSTRFEGKVLATIDGKPMIQHVWERCKKAGLLADVIIACDNDRVLKAATNFGARAVLTSPQHQSGTDRVAEVARNLDADIIINIQGDEPLMDPQVINDLVTCLQSDHCSMATVIRRIEKDDDIHNPNIVKVVIDQNGYALYFSRSAVPYNREPSQSFNGYFKHFGIYGYKKSFLFDVVKLPPSILERTERLEQLRVLEAGYKIKTIQTTFESVGVDTKEDLQKVERMIKNNEYSQN